MAGTHDPLALRGSLSAEGLPADPRDALPARLSVGAALAATLFAAALLTEPLRPAAAHGHLAGNIAQGLGLLVSVFVALAARRVRADGDRIADLAFAFQVSVGTALWVAELAVPFAQTTHTPGLPTVTAWLLICPVLVPLPRRGAAAAAVWVVLAGPLTLLAYLAGGQPPPRPGHMLMWFVAAGLAGIAGVLTASILRQALAAVHRLRDASRYQIEGRLGEGGMGEVFVVQHAGLARRAALKRVRALPSRTQAQRQLLQQRFELEARTIASLRSPHTVELYDAGTTAQGDHFYVMELLYGLDLHTLVVDHGPQHPARVAHLLLQATHALAEAHAAGLVHRDLKPSNLMVLPQGLSHDLLKVLDWGAVLREPSPGSAASDPRLTDLGGFLGTPGYTAPEALLGEVDARADLYALGCVAWWLLTGERLFTDLEDSVARMQAHLHEAPPRLAEVCPLPVPPAWQVLLDHLLAKSPSDRPASAQEVQQALRPLAAGWSASHAQVWWEQRA